MRDALGTAGDLDVIVEAGTTAPPLGVLVGGLGQGLEQRALQTLEQAAATRAAYGEPEPFEVRIEELRPLVRALIAEEIERRLRTRDDGR